MSEDRAMRHHRRPHGCCAAGPMILAVVLALHMFNTFKFKRALVQRNKALGIVEEGPHWKRCQRKQKKVAEQTLLNQSFDYSACSDLDKEEASIQVHAPVVASTMTMPRVVNSIN